MSEEFFLSCPHLKTRPYRPLTSRGTAINGTKVLTLGLVNVAFRINGRFYSNNFRVIRGLVQDVFLGWDWFCSSGAMINPDNGTLDFPRQGDSIPLVKSSLHISGCYYRMPEDFVIPANSKAHHPVEIILNGHDAPLVSYTVETDPFMNATSDVWSIRCTDNVKDGYFMTELINPTDNPVKIEQGRVLGYARFASEEEQEEYAYETDISCNYMSDDSGYKSNDQSDSESSSSDNEDEEEVEEIVCDPPPSTEQGRSHSEPCQPQDTPPPTPLLACTEEEIPPPPPPRRDSSIPEGAKVLKLDFSKIAKEALPYKRRLRHLLEVTHAKAFSRHDRDYGKTHLSQFRANLKDKDLPPISVKAYRTTPEMRKTIDQQAYQMIADGVLGHTT